MRNGRVESVTFSELPLIAKIALASLSLALVGAVDYLTGSDVQVLPLYFVPLLLAGWSLRVTGAIAFSVAATAVWMGNQFAGSAQVAPLWISAVNAATEFSAFLTVAVLVASLRNSLQRERALARIDPLTGLLNRRAIAEHMATSLRQLTNEKAAASVLCIDLDNFKAVNDKFGHERGDQILRAVAELMTACFRRTDILVRSGGDEFVVLLPRADASVANELMHRMTEAAAAHAVLCAANVTFSVGVWSEMPVTSKLEVGLRLADERMYSRKKLRARIASVDSSAC